EVRVPVIRARPQAALLPRPSLRDDTEAADRPRPVRRRTRRRSRTGAGDKTLVIILIRSAVIALMCFLLSIAHWSFAIPPVLIVVLMATVAGFWHLIIAFQEGPMCGLLCLFVPFYSLYYLITRWDETQRPFFLNLAGAFLLIAGAVC